MVTPAARPTCTGCLQRTAVAKGLCLRCYKRRAAGKPLVDPNIARIGTRDGFGEYGVLDDDGTTVLCHECGRRLRALGYHLQVVHGTTAADYRRDHGLPRGLGLVSREISEVASANAKARIGSAGWQRFEDARDPAAAAAARDLVTIAPATIAERSRQAVANGRAARRGRVRTCPYCHATWCPLPGGHTRRTCGSPQCLSAASAKARRSQATTLASQRRSLTEGELHRLRTLTGTALLELVRSLLHEGLTQHVLAPAIGISEAGLSRFLKGVRTPSTDRPRSSAATPAGTITDLDASGQTARAVPTAGRFGR
ncbi:MucR family transcriptional regulator [Streptomyces sp. NRRL S-350]|uniref:MucR family transcriptional regulator n=1 Tax=Streptomyces sp. NRRL S-350 TaxID=1463902 RepID=UPI0004BF4DC2|nr:MucR family transcriptional regulator [Streptomyces sp. NRRL S-350]